MTKDVVGISGRFWQRNAITFHTNTRSKLFTVARDLTDSLVPLGHILSNDASIITYKSKFIIMSAM